MLPNQEQYRTFFEQLQNCKDLDLRDKRGLRHEMSLILVAIILSLLSNRDGNLSSIHRYMKNHQDRLLIFLKMSPKKVVSRAQLPLILERVNLPIFEALLLKNYGVHLTPTERKWFAIDGKSLRGSIEKNSKLGEAIVLGVSHQGGIVHGQEFYSGLKESEITVVRNLLTNKHLSEQNISLDALHCTPNTLSQIHQASGIYLVGLKLNQPELFEDCTDTIRFCQATYNFTHDQREKPKHGRKELRKYQVYDISKDEKHKRWKDCNISTLIKVERDITEVKSNVISSETSLYISNQTENYQQLCEAIRGHWTVETGNYIRDVTFKEDDFKTKKKT